MNELETKFESLTSQKKELVLQLNKIKDKFKDLSDQVEPSDSWLSALPIENIHELYHPRHRLLVLEERDGLKKKGLAMVEDLTRVEQELSMVKLDLLIERINKVTKG